MKTQVNCPMGRVEIETQEGTGIRLIGLKEKEFEIRECLLRTLTALQNCDVKIPGKKIIINVCTALYPTSLIDLPIAIGLYLAAKDCQKANPFPHCSFQGELNLAGDILLSPVNSGQPQDKISITAATTLSDVLRFVDTKLNF